MLATFKAKSFEPQTFLPVARALGIEGQIIMLSTFRAHNFRTRTFDSVARAILESVSGVVLVINPQYMAYYETKDYIAYLLAKNYTARYNGE